MTPQQSSMLISSQADPNFIYLHQTRVKLFLDYIIRSKQNFCQKKEGVPNLHCNALMHCSIDCFILFPIFRPQQVYYSKFGVMCISISKISSSLECNSLLSFINFRSKLYFPMFDYSIAAFPSLSIFSLHICPALRPSIVQWRVSYISYHHYHHHHRHHP